MINALKCLTVLVFVLLALGPSSAQPNGITDLDFLIGVWEVREDNEENGWWEKSTRTGRYILDSTHIELSSTAISSSGKERTYLWIIHFESKKKVFEMVSMFSNWHKIQYDLLDWDGDTRTLTIQNGPDPNSTEYHERLGRIVFNADFSSYIWTGQNKYGDENNPGIWNYVEKGTRIE